MSQTHQILQYMKANGSITSIEALKHFKCFRCAARILDLRDSGHNIQTTMVYEGGKGYAKYSMAGKV